ncbi:MAG: cytochrome C [Pseudomonadota bacterium]
MKRQAALCLLVLAIATAVPAAAAGDAKRGAVAFRACVACHSLEQGVHLTGPSLAGIWGRPAGAAAGFRRYSAPLRRSGIVWDENSLDAWLRDPQALVPGNTMLFQGLEDARARADLIAFLRAASQEGARGSAPAGMRLPRLREAPPSARVKELRYCGDTYYVTNGEGATRPFWEFNLRFKTDSSAAGPAPGTPVLVAQGMQGDRAQVVFAGPREISAFVRERCDE